jgi:iron complex transport system ATP-binding protein
VPDRVARGASLVGATAVSVELGRSTIVRDIDLEVRAGEVVALVGPTFGEVHVARRAAVRDLPLAGGTVALDGEPLDSWTSTELAGVRCCRNTPWSRFPSPSARSCAWGARPGPVPPRPTMTTARWRRRSATDVATLRDRAVHVAVGRGPRDARRRGSPAPSSWCSTSPPRPSTSTIRSGAGNGGTARAAGDGVLVVLHDLGSAALCADRRGASLRGAHHRVRAARAGAGAEVLTEVYRHDVEVLAHPVTGEILVLPRRALVAARPTCIRYP